MQEEKWKLIGGRVYRLAGVFDDLADAVQTAKKLKQNHHAVGQSDGLSIGGQGPRILSAVRSI